jgi:hypothetical protein
MVDDFRQTVEGLLHKADLQEPDCLRDGVWVLAQELMQFQELRAAQRPSYLARRGTRAATRGVPHPVTASQPGRARKPWT